jgi:hypothetical protein
MVIKKGGKLTMRFKLLAPLAVLYVLAGVVARAGDVGYVSCPSGEGYVYLYQSLTSFEVLANLRCGEKVEVVDPRSNIRVKIKTVNGKEGYLPHSALTASAPGSQQQNQPPLTASNAPLPSASVASSITPEPTPQSATALMPPSSTQAVARKHIIPRGSRVYIEPMEGFERTLAAAFDKKQVPLVIVRDKAEADYVITGARQEKDQSTGSKVGMAVMFGVPGLALSGDEMKGSIQIVDVKTALIVYAYTAITVDKPRALAEAWAKHVKNDALAPYGVSDLRKN